MTTYYRDAAHLLAALGEPTRRANMVGRRSTETPPTPIPEGKARCLCNRVVNIKKNGRLRHHRTPTGEDCPITTYGKAVDIDVTQVPIIIDGEPALRTSRPRQVTRDPATPSRLDVGSSCRVCGKWLPGERSVCGKCFALGTTQ